MAVLMIQFKTCLIKLLFISKPVTIKFPVSIVHARLCSTKDFDISKIAKLNHETRFFDGVRSEYVKHRKPSKNALKKFQKGAKDTEINNIESCAQNTGKNSTNVIDRRKDIEIPEFFSFVFENQLVGDNVIDMRKFVSFKDCIEDIGITSLPSLSTILSMTQPKAVADKLQQWKKRMLKELGGEEMFEQYQTDARDKTLNIHKCIEQYLQGNTDFSIKEGNEGYWNSILTVLADVKDVKIIAQECVHPEMFYRGKLVCVANFRDHYCLIQWKTSSKPKPLISSTYDGPIQVAAGIGAANRSGILKKHGISHVRNGAVVVAYSSGEPGDVLIMSSADCERYWQHCDKMAGDWHVSYPDTLSNPSIKEARDYGEAVLRDQEYMKQLPISGYQFISGGTGRQDDQSEVKTDKVLPAYCTPPNPCPHGYTGEDNCVRDFINTPENNRRILYEQDCPCDAEHMLSCPPGMKTIDPKSGFFSDDALGNELDDLGSLESLNNIDLSSGQERFVDMYPALNKEKLDDINPYLYGEAKRIAAKKQVPKRKMK